MYQEKFERELRQALDFANRIRSAQIAGALAQWQLVVLICR